MKKNYYQERFTSTNLFVGNCYTTEKLISNGLIKNSEDRYKETWYDGQTGEIIYRSKNSGILRHLTKKEMYKIIERKNKNI